MVSIMVIVITAGAAFALDDEDDTVAEGTDTGIIAPAATDEDDREDDVLEGPDDDELLLGPLEEVADEVGLEPPPGTKGKLVDVTNGRDVVVDAGTAAFDVDDVGKLDVVVLDPDPSAATNGPD
jgi:hypothetical protein